MTFKELEYLLEINDKLNISELAKELNISRQAIHIWKNKNTIPKKYIKKVLEISNSSTQNKIVVIDVEVDYKKEFILIGNKVSFKGDILEITGINEFGKPIIKEYKKNSYVVNEYEQNAFYMIERYETKIDYKKEIIKYRLYCMCTGVGVLKRKYLFNDSKLARYYNIYELNLYSKIFENYNFKDIVNYVKLKEEDIIIDLDKEKFKEIYNTFNCKSDEKYDIEPMGFYLKADRNIYDKLTKLLEDFCCYQNRKFEYLNCIFICSEVIKENMNYIIFDQNYIEILSKMTKGIYSIDTINTEDLYKVVLTHEIGHLIFSYNQTNDKRVEERKANYIVSRIYNNKYDLFNKYLTTHQSYIYEDILIKPETKLMYESINSTTTNFLKLSDYENYYKEVEKLYE